jgi:outer membrane protein OmpA-like peptidoglycan-associated protein
MEIFFNRTFKTLFLLALLISSSAFSQKAADFPSNLDTFSTPNNDEEESAPAQGGARLLATHPTGAVGLWHTVSALKQPYGPYSFGLFLAGNYYSKVGFPATTPAYVTERFDSHFGVSYTPSPLFEVFMSFGFLTTNDEAPINPLYRQNGNLGIGTKVTYPFTTNITAGGMYWAEKRSAVNVITGSKFALNHELKGLITYDSGTPFRYHGNLGLRIDNNRRVTPAATIDQRQITIFNAYGHSVIPVAFGAEYLMKWAVVSAEYSLDYVMGSAAGFMGQPQRFTLGGRVFPTADQALALQLGLDLGFISSTNATTVVKEPPMSFWFGLNYLFGQQRKKQTDEQPVVAKDFDFPKESKKDKMVESSNQGRITGYITNIETGDPIENVKVFLCNDASNPIVTDSSGRYRSYPLKTGTCEIRLQHPEYKNATETVQVSGDAEQSFDFGLLADLKEKGALLIRVKDSEGNPTASTISFPENPDLQPVETNEFGLAKIQLPAGKYTVRARAPKMKMQNNKVELISKQEIFVDFALEPEGSTAKPVEAPKPVAKLSKDKKTIEISEMIQFEINKSLLTINSTKVLDGVAKVIKNNPNDVKLVQIGGHTDSSGDAAKNLKLSQERADAVKAYLVKKGIDSKRLESKGFGQTKPISDNKTDEGKYQNRRVEFKITTKSAAKPAAKAATKPASKPAVKTSPQAE